MLDATIRRPSSRRDECICLSYIGTLAEFDEKVKPSERLILLIIGLALLCRALNSRLNSDRREKFRLYMNSKILFQVYCCKNLGICRIKLYVVPAVRFSRSPCHHRLTQSLRFAIHKHF
jgi:hypothetical protein